MMKRIVETGLLLMLALSVFCMPVAFAEVLGAEMFDAEVLEGTNWVLIDGTWFYLDVDGMLYEEDPYGLTLPPEAGTEMFAEPARAPEPKPTKKTKKPKATKTPEPVQDLASEWEWEDPFAQAPEDVYESAPVDVYEPAPEDAIAPAPVDAYEPAPEEAFAPAPEVVYEAAQEDAYVPAPVDVYEAPPEGAHVPTSEPALVPASEPLPEIAQESAPAVVDSAPVTEGAFEAVPEVAPEAKQEPVPEPTPEAPKEPLNVSIRASYGGGEARIGDSVRLESVVEGAQYGESLHYQWQYRAPGGDWTNVDGANDEVHSYVADEINAGYAWRLIVTRQ